MDRWSSLNNLSPRSYKCKYCEREVSTKRGYLRDRTDWMIYVCPSCARPSYFEGKTQFPSSLIGNKVEELPENIEILYNEIRECAGLNAYTSAVLASRKLLMHIAVEQGAQQGKNFLEYVNYLADKGFVPPNGREWVNHIREKGNEANHEIKIMSESDAKDLIVFIEMLLKFIYEFPNRIPKKQ